MVASSRSPEPCGVPALQEQIVFVDSATGSERAVPVPGGVVFGLDWLDAGSLVMSQAAEEGAPVQLWRLAYPSGMVTRLTNDSAPTGA